MESTENQTLLPGWARVLFIGRRPKYTAVRVLIIILCSLGLFSFVLRPVRITGDSMRPTYRNGSVNFVNRLAYVFSEPQRGDVVGIRMAGESVMFMKRIIGKPGETIEFREGRAYVDGELLDEPYLKLPCDWNTAPVKLGRDSYYFIGDNRSMAREDHTGGERERSRIVGKVLL